VRARATITAASPVRNDAVTLPSSAWAILELRAEERKEDAVSRVADHFGDIAATYDSSALRGMPQYEEMLSEVIRCLPEGPNEVLELGCGTGRLTALLAVRYSGASLTAVDAAPQMVEIARNRLLDSLGAQQRVSFVVSLFEEMNLPVHGYDLIASNMSLHHIADKAPFYRRLHDALRPGCFLVFGDELNSAAPHVHTLNREGWLEFARQPGHLSEEEIEQTLRHEQESDHYETLPDQIELLRGAGFDSADCVWRYQIYGVFVAKA
jgi:ubiquinone/menaquinone biosynthesis C-methylase UbiE